MKKTLLTSSIILLPSLTLAADKTPTIDSGNTAWVLVSAALVMLMTPGLAFFYAGMVSRKNVVSTLLQNYAALALVGVIWVVIGYSLVFSDGNALIGGLSQFMLEGLDDKIYADYNIPYYAYIAFQMMFAIITPALITGAFAERVRFRPWLFIMGIWSILVYLPVAHWVWGPKGWIASLGGLDFAGGLVVHTTAGFSALVAALLYGKRYQGPHTVPNDIPFIMLGAALLWFGWFGFNAGSALTSGALASHAFMTTFIGSAAAFLAWMITDWIRTGKPSAVGASVGLVVGLVAITPAAGYVSLGSAIWMCALAAVICNFTASWFKKISHLDDALDVFACHGIGAVVGTILTGALATKAVNSSIEHQGILIDGDTKVFAANIIGTVAVAAYSMIMTYIIIKAVNLITPVRASEDEQDRGLDDTMHGEKAKHSGSEPTPFLDNYKLQKLRRSERQ